MQILTSSGRPAHGLVTAKFLFRRNNNNKQNAAGKEVRTRSVRRADMSCSVWGSRADRIGLRPGFASIF